MSWKREDHRARVMPALGVVIDITPTPEQRVNRRVTKMELAAHQQRRAVAVDAARERMALEAANEALHPLAQTWWARLSRALRSLMGGR